MTKPAVSLAGQDQKRPTGLEKRKACDLCHHKRIRCDAGKPTCSHCVVYGAQCIYTPHISRIQKVSKSRTPASKTAKLELRLAELEAKMINGREPRVLKDDPRTTTFSSVEEPSLPALEDLVPIVDDYFANFNSALPIFQRARFMAMVQGLSPSNPRHDPVAWAAVNVVMAIAWHHRASRKTPCGLWSADKCIADVHSVMNTLVTREHDLLGLQVLLGLVIVYKPTPHPTQAALLLATAVKLSHRLRIHERQSGAHLDPESRVERNRVFWITYALDRDLSMRTGEPYLLRDSEMDVDMPVSSGEHGTIEVLSDSGSKVEFDLLAAQVHLARIQGAIHDALYSVFEEASPLNELRRVRRQHLSHMLEEWLGAIPMELQSERVLGDSPGSRARPVLLMHFTYLHCLFRVHRVCSHNAEWIRRLVGYSQGHAVGSCETEPLLSSSWTQIVDAARACMRLFRLVDRSDEAFIRNVSCIYVSAMTILLANHLTLSDRSHDIPAQVSGDDQLIDEAVGYLRRAAEESGEDMIKRLYSASCELSCRARVAGRRFLSAQPTAKSMTPGLAWLEAEAVKSASNSALALVEAFVGCSAKPLPRRMVLGTWQ